MDSPIKQQQQQKTVAATKAGIRDHKHKLVAAKKSGVRTKFLIESFRQEYYELRDENTWLREIVQQHLPKHVAEQILAECFDPYSDETKVSNVSAIDDLAAQMPRSLSMKEGGESDGDDDDKMDDEEENDIGF